MPPEEPALPSAPIRFEQQDWHHCDLCADHSFGCLFALKSVDRMREPNGSLGFVTCIGAVEVRSDVSSVGVVSSVLFIDSTRDVNGVLIAQAQQRDVSLDRVRLQSFDPEGAKPDHWGKVSPAPAINRSGKEDGIQSAVQLDAHGSRPHSRAVAAGPNYHRIA